MTASIPADNPATRISLDCSEFQSCGEEIVSLLERLPKPLSDPARDTLDDFLGILESGEIVFDFDNVPATPTDDTREVRANLRVPKFMTDLSAALRAINVDDDLADSDPG